jgi:REP element-mobilizing transposase RayT
MARLFIDTMYLYRRDHKFLIHRFVVMRDHVHLLLSPLGVDLPRAVQLIKGGFSYRAKKELGVGFGSGDMWIIASEMRMIIGSTLNTLIRIRYSRDCDSAGGASVFLSTSGI